MRIEFLPVDFNFSEEDCKMVLSGASEELQLSMLTHVINGTFPAMKTANRDTLYRFKQAMGVELVSRLEAELAKKYGAKFTEEQQVPF